MTSKERIAFALSVCTDTRHFEMGRGAAAKAPGVFREFFPGRKALIVADIHTWPALGEKVYGLFIEEGIPTERHIIMEEEFHAEWKYVEMVDALLDAAPDAVLVSVGSGVINDLCKLSSHHHNQSYLTLPTAASVDGYSSFGASITFQGAKQTFSCPAPVAIVADIDVIAAAPAHMTAAGYADLAAKVPAGAEWIVADFVGKAPIHQDAWHLLQDHLDGFLSNPDAVAAGDPDAIADVFEGLTLSGFAMQAARSSRPASCCDHLFSHILDMTEHRYKGRLQSHGFQVAIGTLTMCAVFDELFKLDLSALDVDACVAAWPSLEQEQERALDLFKDFPAPRLGYDEITKKYDPADNVREQLAKLKAEWTELKTRLQGQAYSFAKMKDLMHRAGAPSDPSEIGLSREKLCSMFPLVQLMRFRFNLLDLGKRGGFYDAIVDPLFAQRGPFEL
ncbi:MAG: iron-containing alcohol dehydrogenase [Bacteroidales bacterium]|nr:iron-containing alcohol dehydrogenase [Bacteroidales bacterium]